MWQLWESWGNLQSCRELDPHVHSSLERGTCTALTHTPQRKALNQPQHIGQGFKLKHSFITGSATGGRSPWAVLLVVFVTASPGTGDGESLKHLLCSPRPGGDFWELFQAARAATPFLLHVYVHQGSPGSAH